MHVKNLNLIMMLIAGIIVGLISMLMNYSLQRLMYTLFVVLAVFFVIGTAIQMLLNRIFDVTDEDQRNREIAELVEEEKELEQVPDIGAETEIENPDL